ncbi:MAG: TetR/AcrR family transcriptional regulator [Algoriphagus sp.]|jgi:AcrR family transcriptional regulator|uniref:TetR/AcrR family transcriptional regulator n=1 Tax=Algoriphagus sp. TaxID=1872435 RepID=UPI0026273B07|nr:TetR/AcrR family transcriptional regulator [Algoriphagus sp.]MDG1277223.1 TetR/AcrR family transcriptional regulator [Algoriphagus sp.]
MESILSKSKVEVNGNLYLKEPFSSDLGAEIVRKGCKLIQELGVEQFTFKKLATEIGSTEAAIYRYFENKHKLLLYLTAWYWGWMEINLVYATANLTDPGERLGVALKLMVDGPIFTKNEYLNPLVLRSLVVNESLKGYLTKAVDDEHESGIFAQVYKFGERISSIIQEINPYYEYPKTLVSTVMESSLLQSFNSLHLPGMTERSIDSLGRYQFFHQLVINAITNEK